MGMVYWLLALYCLSVPVGVYAGEGTQTLSREQVQATLRQFVMERVPWQPDQVEVRVRPFASAPLPVGTVALRILKADEAIVPGPHNFFLRVNVGHRECSQLWVRADIEVFADVVVASRPLARFETFGPGDARLERRELTLASMRALTRIDEVVGKQAARAIGVNEILTSSAVDLPRVVPRGGIVTLVYETNGLELETPGRALEDGRIGDVIKVRNASSGKVLDGKVLDPHKVRVNW